MNYFTTFLMLLFWSPYRALASLYWYLTGRKVRARNRLRMASAQSPFAYAIWIDEIEKQAEATSRAKAEMSDWDRHPRFTLVMPFLNENDLTPLMMSLRAAEDQCLGQWKLIIVRGDKVRDLPDLDDDRISVAASIASDAVEALNIGMAVADGEYIVPLAPGTILTPTALFNYARSAMANDSPAVLFGDQDECDYRLVRSHPWFKPQWNDEMFLAQDYISSACAVRADIARAVGPLEADLSEAALFALFLRITGAEDAKIVHIASIQCHLLSPVPDNQADRVRAVSRHLAARGALVTAGPFQSVKVQWPLPAEQPLVSIIVPTRDKVKLLRACVTGVLSGTRYRNIELLIVDNGSVHPATLSYLKHIGLHPKVRVLPFNHPYNYSAINNFAATQAQGDYLCLLNNDTDVLDENWLTELMRYATKAEVGAVGAKLLYDDGTIQHAGVVVGMGEAAGHAHRFLKPNDPGYFRQAHIPQYVSAVTAACLVVEKRKYMAVGGLDEAGLQIAFNDVDLCLKLDKAGWRNVYAPQAVMIHHESKSRGSDHSPEHIDRYMSELGVLQQRWNTKTHADPLHHPRLDRSSETFVINL